MQRRKSLGTLTRDCAIIFLFCMAIFGFSYPAIPKLKEKENWIPAIGTVISIKSEEYYDESEKTYRLRESGKLEFTQEDGTVRQVNFEWVSEQATSVGHERNMIYDPDSSKWSFGDLPEQGDYMAVYITRYIAFAVALAAVIRWIVGYFKSKRVE